MHTHFQLEVRMHFIRKYKGFVHFLTPLRSFTNGNEIIVWQRTFYCLFAKAISWELWEKHVQKLVLKQAEFWCFLQLFENQHHKV